MRRLYTRIYLHFVGVLLVVGLAFSFIFTHFWRRDVHGGPPRLAHHIASLIAAESKFEDQSSAARRLAEDLDLDLTLRDPEGHLTFATAHEMPPLTPSEVNSLDEDDPQPRHNGDDHFLAAPILRDGKMIGYVELSPLRRVRSPRLWRPLLNILLVLIIVGVATGPLAGRISRPVEHLTEASERFGAGELGYRINDGPYRKRKDEVAQLIRKWNEMARRVEQLVAGQRELLANVSHELRSPLARVGVALELLPKNAGTEERLSDVKTDLAELERLIDAVLTTSKLDMAGFRASKEHFALAPLFAQLVMRAEHDAVTTGKQVSQGALAVAEVNADGSLIKRALWNLVENAAKYGAPPIILSAETSDGKIRLMVSDRGSGIPEDDRARVLEPFYRIDKARTPDQNRGFGLGLTIARRIAEVHGGRIIIESSESGGARIGLELPT